MLDHFVVQSKGGLISEGILTLSHCQQKLPNHFPEQKIWTWCLLTRAGHSNVLLRGVIWHFLLAMGPNSKYLLRSTHFYQKKTLFPSIMRKVVILNENLHSETCLMTIILSPKLHIFAKKIHILSLIPRNFLYCYYGNTGCGVFKRGIQN